MQIKSAKFLTSCPDVSQCPESTFPEYAFIGRSNVGKSSLINTLLAHKNLAKTSATPGKTMLINYFVVNDSFYIVDLPGYGYARRGKESRELLQKMIQRYVTLRGQLTNLFLLIDSRLEPQKIDLEFIEFLGENQIPFSIVFTKMDKMGPVAGAAKVKAYTDFLLESWEELPPIFLTSSQDNRGREELLNYIDDLNRLVRESE
ncbi:MAG: YihA family ribosome biogenesis GTP-binding protein [Muribaculaceae bacterium]|nr:YihA family ribosome biogenesis GTP-binding protein [Muribaculaceae bacterium]